MRAPACPLCGDIVRVELITTPEPFECPHCSELLAVVRRPAHAGVWVIVAFVVTLSLHRRFTFFGLLGAIFLVPVAIGLLNFAFDRIFGYELEPVGRVPLGDLDQ